MTTDLVGGPETRPRRQRGALRWIVCFAAVAVLFDGYTLLVYGVVVPAVLRDAGQIGAFSPARAGAVGSCALLGALVGAVGAGAVGDRVGRRRMMLISFAWFSPAMGLNAVVTGVTAFGLPRSGRLGGVLGPLAGGVPVSAGAATHHTFYLFAGVGLLGVPVTVLATRREAVPAAPGPTPV